MGDASFQVTSFLGGQISKFAQGRTDRPDYKISLNVCLNALPVEIGAWTRRPGTRYAHHTRGGAQGRGLRFDFDQRAPYTVELTAAKARFRQGVELATTNDEQDVSGISSATPAVVTTGTHEWADEDTVMFPSPAPAPLLENRQCTITILSPTTFSLQDALTGDDIDGSALGTIGAGTVVRVQEIDTPFSDVAGVRSVQAQRSAILLNRSHQPQVLSVLTDPAEDTDAVFDIDPAVFLDGPYLDPFTNGVRATPSALSGSITLTLDFPAYSASKAYKEGDFVTSSSVNYVSLQDNNVNHTPASSAAYWETTSAGAAIAPDGFVGTDVGRLVRLFSEPLEWAVGTAYTAGNVVSYNPSGVPGATTYWTALTSTTGDIPGIDTTNWILTPANSSIWSWGRITGLSTQIAQSGGGIVHIGDMTAGGGIAAAFSGTVSQPAASSASITQPMSVTSFRGYVGQDYSALGAQAIASVALYPSSNNGFARLSSGSSAGISLTFNLRASNTLPANSSDGTLLGTSGVLSSLTAAVTIVSDDQVTTYEYVWIEGVCSGSITPADLVSMYVSQMLLYNPASSATSSGGIVIELLGPPLLYTSAISTWRLGAYSNTTGWPTVGCYHEGRLWLAGAIQNRFDACVSNGVDDVRLDFAPTGQTGTVAPNNAISYTLNSDGVNPIFWLKPDRQGIIAGTQAGEYLIHAPTDGPIAPANIAAPLMTENGCANIEPVRTENTTLFVQRFNRKLMEYFADVMSGKFSAPNLADKAPIEITKPGLAEIAYQHAVTPVVWGRNADGDLFGMTYKRDALNTALGPTYNGWHRHTLGTGRTVEGIVSGPSVDGTKDSVTMITTDADGIRHVEVLTDTPDEGAAIGEAWLLDDAVVPSSTSTTHLPTDGQPYGALTINGLWHLNGKSVTVFCAGIDCGEFTVEDGSIDVPFGDGISGGTGDGLFTSVSATAAIAAGQLIVGMQYNSDGQIVRPNDPVWAGTRSGPAFGKKQRSQQYVIEVEGTARLSIGTGFGASQLRSVLFKDAANRNLQPGNTFSGIYRDALDDDYSYSSKLAWRAEGPLPANLISVGAALQTQDA